MSRFGWAFVNDVIIGTGSAGTGSAVDGPVNAVIVKDSGIISGATNFNFNNSTGFGQLTGSLAITSNLTVNGNLTSGPISTTTVTATSYVSASSLTGTLRSNTGNKFGSAAGDVHQFTGSISAGIVSGTVTQFTTISGSTLTGSSLLINNATVNSATISTLTSTTNTSNVLYVTGATNSIISGKEINSLGSLSVSNIIEGSPLSLENTTVFYIKPDGSKLYAHDTTSAELVECTLATPWDISAASVSRTSTYLNTPVASSIASGLTFKPDGTKAYILLSSPTSEQLYETTLSVPWDLSYASAWTLKVRLTGSGAITGQKGISISEDGRYLFTCSGSTVNSFVLKYTMSTPWDASTVSHTTPVSASVVLEAATKNSTISNDGKSILILDASNYLHDFELSIPYELTTVTKKSSVDLDTLSPTYGVSSGIFLKPDQTNIFFNAANGSNKHFISLAMTSSQVDLVGGIHITGDARITQNINVYGDATFEDLSGSNAQFRILSASSADINGGTIDGTTIATSDITVGAGKTLNVSAGTLTLNAAQIGADKIAGATFGAGTYSFSGRTISNLGSVTTADIDGGTIDGTTIGVTSATTGKFTELTASTNLSASQIFLGTGGMTASSNIIPNVNNAYDLGSTNNRWRDIYVSSSINVPNISAVNITASNVVRTTGSNAYIVVGTGSNNTIIEIAHTGAVYRGIRMLSGGVEKWFAGANLSDNYIIGYSPTSASPLTFSGSTQNISLSWPLSGTAITASSVDINGGTIDDVVFNGSIGTGTANLGKFTQVSASTGISGAIAQFGTINSDLIPNAANTYRLGSNSSGNTWASINAGQITGSTGLSGSQGQFSQLTASIIRSTGSNAYIAIGTGSNNTLVEVSHTNGNVYRGMRLLSGSTEKWFAGASTTDTYVIRRSGSTNDLIIDGNGNLTASADLRVTGDTTFDGSVYNNSGVYVNTRNVTSADNIINRSLQVSDYLIFLDGATSFNFSIGTPSAAGAGRMVMFRNTSGAASMAISASSAVILANLGSSAPTTTYTLGGTADNTGAIFISDGTYWYRIANS